MNLSFIIGNLAKEPQKIELDGKSLCKLNVAVNENFTKEDGTRPVQFFNVAVWGKVAENCLKYLKKGSKVGVLGKIQNRTWEDDNGNKHYAQEIVASEIEFLSSSSKQQTPEGLQEANIDDESLPF